MIKEYKFVSKLLCSHPWADHLNSLKRDRNLCLVSKVIITHEAIKEATYTKSRSCSKSKQLIKHNYILCLEYVDSEELSRLLHPSTYHMKTVEYMRKILVITVQGKRSKFDIELH